MKVTDIESCELAGNILTGIDLLKARLAISEQWATDELPYIVSSSPAGEKRIAVVMAILKAARPLVFLEGLLLAVVNTHGGRPCYARIESVDCVTDTLVLVLSDPEDYKLILPGMIVAQLPM